jgi:hypothetical protein
MCAPVYIPLARSHESETLRERILHLAEAYFLDWKRQAQAGRMELNGEGHVSNLISKRRQIGR